MEQIKLGNGTTYTLVVGGVFEQQDDKLRITVKPGEKSFSDIESDFDNALNTQKIKIINVDGETMSVKNNYTALESITKQNGYVTGSEKYTDEDGEVSYKDIIEMVYTVTLSKPDLREQVNNIQETVDALVLSELGV